ncbi:MAG: diguanylate cyclase, partial [Planctomycetes bacterium]|nr:diguanylate cyclase [Planctomycetota bacterium]
PARWAMRRADRPEADATAGARSGENDDGLEGIIPRGVLRSLLSALQHRDAATVRHARRTAMLATGMARHLKWEGRPLKVLEVAALVHDIGKIGVPDHILLKPGKLSADEAELMVLHHNVAVDVLQSCRVEPQVVEFVMQAHRFYDGFRENEYRLGRDVHQGARILAVADAYDSLRTDQTYRPGKPHDEIMQVLREAGGVQFDGNVVETLGRWIQQEGLPFDADEVSPREPASADGPASLECDTLCQIFSYLYVLESLYDGFYLVDSDLRFVVWNRGAETLTGRPAADMLGQTWTRELLKPSSADGHRLPEGQCPMQRVIADGRPMTTLGRIQSADGRWLDIESQAVPIADAEGRLHGVAEIFRNLSRTTRRPREYRELKIAASRDALTSLANRGELETQLALLLKDFHGGKSQGELFSVIFLDIDFFKSINDTRGHALGDRVLVDVARLLEQETYSGELVGRYGGEEFVVLCPGTGLDDAYRRAERLRNSLAAARIAELNDFKVTASFGVATVEEGDSVQSLLRRADSAMYMAKAAGRNKSRSLTVAEQSREEARPPEDIDPDPFVFRASFKACVAANMIVYKLGGFVNDYGARLKDVGETRAVLHVGSLGLWPFWGRRDSRRPVEVEVCFEAPDSPTSPGRRLTSPQIDVRVVVRPRGRIRNAETFERRARDVVKTLRSYFVAG